VGLSSNFFQFA